MTPSFNIILVILQVILFTFQITNGNECKMNFLTSKDILKKLTSNIVPTLNGKSKGDLGRIGIIGGSVEYTGAPYFSAIAAFKAGADIVYVITTEDAAPVIKIYSPDLIVYPFLNKKYASKISSLLPKMDAIVIGPGLGREDETMKLTYDIIESCKVLEKPIVIDADGLYAISKNISIIQDYPKAGAILTPNGRESKKLMESINSNGSNWFNYWGENVSVLEKGETDKFHSRVPSYNWASSEGGSERRVGGQGDFLSGSLATFYHWALTSDVCQGEQHGQISQSLASYAAARLVRTCNSQAFEKYGRSMMASDMIKEIHSAYKKVFED
ncbi:ATP-dependent (S)-NAD(P)H-hydrate dehydratase [Bombyx mori]|uniref:ATP-dependent (S)-NAD(P)H-hydrate dehydratase n=1 Tax=Bombyx mori TaxID=7091 RepID=A0A8R1WHT8_BOMMO|nr:ATP-dependent (S)-NAD(P)H-hydrate dehydratase [Bombyx mori]